MSANLVVDGQGNRIRRFPNGFWYVKPADKDQYSEKASATLVKAQEHLNKLHQGFVKFNPLAAREKHKPAFNPNFCNSASTRTRLK